MCTLCVRGICVYKRKIKTILPIFDTKKWYFLAFILYCQLYTCTCILYLGRKVRILVVLSKNCGLRTVNSALSHSDWRTHMISVVDLFFPRIVDECAHTGGSICPLGRGITTKENANGPYYHFLPHL